MSLKPRSFWQRFSTRSLVTLLGILGAFYLAIIDASLRARAMDISLAIVAGYFGQLEPGNKKKEIIDDGTVTDDRDPPTDGN